MSIWPIPENEVGQYKENLRHGLSVAANRLYLIENRTNSGSGHDYPVKGGHKFTWDQVHRMLERSVFSFYMDLRDVGDKTYADQILRQHGLQRMIAKN